MDSFLTLAQASDGLSGGTILVLILIVVMGTASADRWSARCTGRVRANRPEFDPNAGVKERRGPVRAANHLRYFDGE